MGWNQWSLFFTPSDAKNIPEVGRFQEWFEKTGPGTSLCLNDNRRAVDLAVPTALGMRLERELRYQVNRHARAHEGG